VKRSLLRRRPSSSPDLFYDASRQGDTGNSDCSSLRNDTSRSAVNIWQLTRADTQSRRADNISIPSSESAAAAARAAYSAISVASKGALLHRNTCARSAAMISSGVLLGARTITLTPGRLALISDNSARSSSMLVAGSVMTTSYGARRRRHSASALPVAMVDHAITLSQAFFQGLAQPGFITNQQDSARNCLAGELSMHRDLIRRTHGTPRPLGEILGSRQIVYACLPCEGILRAESAESLSKSSFHSLRGSESIRSASSGAPGSRASPALSKLRPYTGAVLKLECGGIGGTTGRLGAEGICMIFLKSVLGVDSHRLGISGG